MADVIVEKERNSSAGPVVAVVAIVILILLAIWGLPYLFGMNNNSPATAPVTTAPTE